MGLIVCRGVIGCFFCIILIICFVLVKKRFLFVRLMNSIEGCVDYK